MYVVYNNFKQFSKKNFQFGKVYKTPTNDVYNLYLCENNIHKKIYFVSQKLKLAWDKTYNNDDTSFSFELCNYENSFVDSFQKLICFILRHFKKKVLDKNYNEENMKIDQFKKYSNGSISMRLYNNKLSDILIYDESYSQIDSKLLKKNDIINVLFELKSCWVKDEKFGFDFNVVQIMRLIPNNIMNQQYLIESSQGIKKNHILLNEIRNFKQLSNKQNNNKPSNISGTQLHPPLPPPLPPKLKLNKNSKIPQLKFSIEDLKNAKNNLRKNTTNNN